MSENIEKNKLHFFERYLGQKSVLPSAIREKISERVLLYSFVDLNEALQSANQWLVLTKKHLWLFSESHAEVLAMIDLNQIGSVRELSGLSSYSLNFISTTKTETSQLDLLLLRVTSTLRQKPMLTQIQFYMTALCENKGPSDMDFDADKQYQSAVTRPVIEAQNSVTSKDRETLWRLLGYLAPYKRDLWIGGAGAVGATLVGLIPAYISGRLIDEVVKPFQDSSLQLNEALTIGWIMIAALAVSYAVREFFMWLRLRKMNILGEQVSYDLRMELYRHLQTLSVDFFSKKHSGSIITRVASDTDRIWDFIAFGVVEVGISILMLISLAAVLITLDPILGLMMTVPVPLLLLSIYVHGEKMKKYFLRAWRKWSEVTSVLSDTIPGIQVVKAFNQEQREVKRFNQKLDRVTDEFFRIHNAWTKFWPLLMFGIHGVVLLTWSVAFPRLVSSQPGLTAGVFVSFLLYMTMFAQPIEIIGQVARMLNRALSSAYRIFELLDAKAAITNSPNAVVLEEVQGDVRFENVLFSYDGVRTVVKNMNFHVRPGEMIGLVGESGGGKSTLTKLLARFYDVSGGRITVDGVDIRELDASILRKSIGMVLQDPYLFHGKIWENISYGFPEASRQQIVEAARIANAHDFITQLPFGYDTAVGERGHTLSGGERQRISIARAVLANPKILILDEATSAVDTETERKIQEALDHLVKGRTVFAIAHRLSTLRKADRIFVIKKGEMVEMGTHDELLARSDGEYFKLHQLQRERNAKMYELN